MPKACFTTCGNNGPVRRLAEAEADGNSSANGATNSSDSTNLPVAVIKQWILPTGNDFIKDASH